MMEKGKRPDAGNIGPKQELVFNDLITPQILSRAQDKINNSTVFRDTIERIREHNDIVSVISEHVKLKRSGKNYFGLCPFHEEKTPSFSVSPSSQRFKCYGCGESGDIFDFIGAIENLSFLDSLRLLGQRAGISVLISTENEEALKKKERFRSVMKAVGKFFYQQLFSAHGKPALEYMQKRGFEQEFLKEIGFGFAPNYDYKEELIAFTQATEEELLHLGILHRYENNVGVYFKNMVLIPFFRNGKLVMYQGRRIDEDNRYGKYKKPTSETIEFLKADDLLWNIDAARNKKELHLFEGILDAATAVQLGLRHSAALPGSQFNDKQIATLHAIEKIYVWMDQDEAGTGAIEQLIGKLGKRVRIVSLDEEKKDLNEWWIHAKGTYGEAKAKDRLRQLIASSKDPLQFKLAKLREAEETEWSDFIKEIAALAIKWADPVRLEIVKGEIQEITKLTKRTIQKMFKEAEKSWAKLAYVQKETRNEAGNGKKILIDEFRKAFYVEEYDMEGNMYVVYVSNFLVEPIYTRIMENGERMYEIHIFNDYDSAYVNISGRNLVNYREFKSFCRERGEFLWTGKDEELVLLNEYLIEQRVPIITNVPCIGYHAEAQTWFFPTYAFRDGQVYHADENGVFWIDEKGYVVEKNPAFSIAKPLIETAPTREEIIEYMDAMESVYGNYGWLGMGWIISSLQAHMISKKIKQFPYLYATGLFERGKTTFLQNLFQFAGLDASLPTLPSKDTWRKNVAWFSSLPVGYDEANEKGRNKKGRDFFDTMREYINQTFNRTMLERGTLDANKTIQYPIRATIAFAGEFPVSIPSVQSRTIFVNSLHFKRNEDAINILQEKADVATWIGQHMMRTSAEWQTEWLDNYAVLYENYLKAWNGASRVKKNYAIVLAGAVTLMQTIDSMLNEQRYSGIQIHELIELLKEESETNHSETKQNHPCIEYLRDIAIMAYERRLLKNVHFAIELVGDKKMLYISPSLTWDAYLQKQGNREVVYSSSRKIAGDLQFFGFFHGAKKRRLGKMVVRAWEIEIDHPELPEEIKFFEYEAYD